MPKDEALRKQLQVSAHVRRDSSWQLIAARELVPGDIVRVRSGDVIPAGVKLLTGALSVDQSALTGESKDAPQGVAGCIICATMRSRTVGQPASQESRAFQTSLLQLV